MRTRAAHATRHATPELPPRVERRLERWLERWGVPRLSSKLRVEFSPRLTRAFGRCYLERRLIRLTPSLLGTQASLLDEILCHEAAHAAVFERHGARARHHGPEWEALMREAGFEPRVRIPVAVRTRGSSTKRSALVRGGSTSRTSRTSSTPAPDRRRRRR